MNWKLTRANLPVIFEAGEPICMIVPQRRGELEAFHPEIRELEEEPEPASAFSGGPKAGENSTETSRCQTLRP